MYVFYKQKTCSLSRLLEFYMKEWLWMDAVSVKEQVTLEWGMKLEFK